MRNKQVHILLLTILMCSCNVYRKNERPESLRIDSAYKDLAAAGTISISNILWKDFFSDMCLQVLIEQGLENNTDLKIASLRIGEAQASLQAARQSFAPAFSLEADGTLRSFDGAKTSKAYNVGVTADWEVDVSGKLTNQLRSDRMGVLKAEANRQAVHSQLIASIAEEYYSLLMLDKQLEISERTLLSWEKTMQVLRSLKRAGNASEAALNQAEASRLEVETRVLTLRKQIKSGENAMASLLGISPQPIARGDLSKQQFVSILSAGIPLQLLSNRPDVRQCEYEMEQAFYATNRARAAFYPSMTLSGTMGWTNNGLSVANPGGILFNAVASLAQPLFNRGKNKANLKISKLQQVEVLLSFQQKLLDAGIEVNNALTGWQTAHEQSEVARKEVEVLRKAVMNTQLTMQHGNVTYLEVLTAEQSLLQAELNEVSVQFDEFQNIINLYYALGGGGN